MQELFQRKRFGSLQVREQTCGPHEDECEDRAIHEEHQPGRLDIVQREQANAEENDKEQRGTQERGNAQNRQDHDIGNAAALQLVNAKPPAQPKEGAQMLPIHSTFSSNQVSLGVTVASAPAFSKKRSSSEAP